MAGRYPVCEKVCGKGQDLVNQGHSARGEIGSRIRALMDKWKQLQDLAKAKRTKLEDSIEAHQVRVTSPKKYVNVKLCESFFSLLNDTLL